MIPAVPHCRRGRGWRQQVGRVLEPGRRVSKGPPMKAVTSGSPQSARARSRSSQLQMRKRRRAVGSGQAGRRPGRLRRAGVTTRDRASNSRDRAVHRYGCPARDRDRTGRGVAPRSVSVIARAGGVVGRGRAAARRSTYVTGRVRRLDRRDTRRARPGQGVTRRYVGVLGQSTSRPACDTAFPGQASTMHRRCIELPRPAAAMPAQPRPCPAQPRPCPVKRSRVPAYCGRRSACHGRPACALLL